MFEITENQYLLCSICKMYLNIAYYNNIKMYMFIEQYTND